MSNGKGSNNICIYSTWIERVGATTLIRIDPVSLDFFFVTQHVPHGWLIDSFAYRDKINDWIDFLIYSLPLVSSLRFVSDREEIVPCQKAEQSCRLLCGAGKIRGKTRSILCQEYICICKVSMKLELIKTYVKCVQRQDGPSEKKWVWYGTVWYKSSR